MKKRGSRKKGVSPLIATVLLISFVIIIAILVYNWWGNIVKTRASKTGTESESNIACSLQLEFKVKDYCYEEDTDDEGGKGFITLTIENTGKVPINGIKLRVKGTGASGEVTEVLTSSEDINEGAAKKTSLASTIYDLGDISINRIEVLPVVRARGAESVCTEKSKIITRINTCT